MACGHSDLHNGRTTPVSEAKEVVKPIIPLPATRSDWVRKTQFNRTINDQVEDIHLALLDDEEYIELLQAVYDEQAVEGSLSSDNNMAAIKIRNAAKKMNNPVKDQKLATIIKALGVVLRRYGVSRKERRNMVGGEVVNTDNGGNE